MFWALTVSNNSHNDETLKYLCLADYSGYTQGGHVVLLKHSHSLNIEADPVDSTDMNGYRLNDLLTFVQMLDSQADILHWLAAF